MEGRRMTLQIVLAGTKQRAKQWQLLVKGERVNVGERFPGQDDAVEEKSMHFSSAEDDICLESGERVNVSERFPGQDGAVEEKSIHFAPAGSERVNVGERFPGQDDALEEKSMHFTPAESERVNVGERFSDQDGVVEKKNQHSPVEEANVHTDDLPPGCPMFPKHRHFWRRPTGGWVCCSCHPPVAADVEIVELSE
jgi:hypothetical protein